jgi:hypothetical protein
MTGRGLSRRTFCASLLAYGAFGLELEEQDERPRPRTLAHIPPRPASAPTGSSFAAVTAGATGPQRQARTVEELLSGNVPGFLRTLVPVGLWASASVRRRAPTRPDAWIWVLPDYLALGTDDDFLRVPLTLAAALQIAGAWDMYLPTRKMVDAVYRQAEVRLDPRPLLPGPKMRSSEYYLRHHQLIEAARKDRPLGALTAGHKKDVLLTKRLARQADRIAIYGWHRGDGQPIQPLSLMHGARYADYSHGVRLVDSTCLRQGAERRLGAMLIDPVEAPIFSFEGEMPRSLVRIR